MKKIALIMPPELPVPSVMGGAVEELVTILIEQNEIEKKAEFIVFSVENKEAEERAKQYKYTKVIYIPAASFSDRLINRVLRYLGKVYKKKTLLDVAHYRKAYEYLKNENVDAIVAEGGMYHEFRRFAEEFGEEKLYLHIHHHLLCEPKIDNIFGNVIGISEFARKEWMLTTTNQKTKSHVLYNCVNEEKFIKGISASSRENIRSSFGFTNDDYVVLYCGRILEVKGVRELLLAINEIEDSHIKLLIIGNVDFALNTSTPYMEEIKKLVEKAGERVKFTGYIQNAELYKYYQASDIQVIPSLWEEAAGLVAIEGMLSKLPLIVTKSGGLIEYAPEDVAVWVERNGIVENLKSNIVELVHDKDKMDRMKKASIKQAQNFSKKMFYDKFIQIMNKE